MKKIILASISVMVYAGAMAQETYENANLATEDLNGTARYVGMGGAMDALGADISTIGSNPAGIGLFRHSTARVSFGFVSQQEASDFADANKTSLSFDQAGFVWSTRSGRRSFLNFAFNYKKSRNFNHILSAAGALHGASQNKLSYIKGDQGVFDPKVDNGYVYSESNRFSQLDELYYNAFLYEGFDNESGTHVFGYNDATDYTFNRANTGYIGEYDLNISGNINDRVYLGLTVGIHDVHYSGYSEYQENVMDRDGLGIGSVGIADSRRITGTGYNVKAGVIFRPLEYSPFRIGLSVATPTWYDLTTSNYTQIKNTTDIGYSDGEIDNQYDFKLYTPWKFGVSMGTTIGNYLALGAGYEFADYGSNDSRINDGGYFDYYYDSYYSSSNSDRAMNAHTKQALKGVSTLRLGAEFKPDPSIAVRFGYNYVSPMYKSNAEKDFTISSPGVSYSTSADFTNWKSTNRITCGLGYNIDKFSIDVAYQYSVQNGEFSPFTSTEVGMGVDAYGTPVNLDNLCGKVDVSNKRHQVILTMGYTF